METEKSCCTRIEAEFERVRAEEKSLLELLARRVDIEFRYAKDLRDLCEDFSILKVAGSSKELVQILALAHLNASKASRELARELSKLVKDQVADQLHRELKPLLAKLRLYEKECT
jgi:hypothetical protein